MPYTIALKPFPRIPNEQAPIVQPTTGKPTKEFVTFLTELRTWAATVQAALNEVEP